MAFKGISLETSVPYADEYDTGTGNSWFDRVDYDSKKEEAEMNVYQQILSNIEQCVSEHKDNQDLVELYNTLIEKSLDYTRACVQLELAMDRSDFIDDREKAELRSKLDQSRSIAHNATLMAWNILHRFMRKNNIPIDWDVPEDRVALGCLFREAAGKEYIKLQKRRKKLANNG